MSDVSKRFYSLSDLETLLNIGRTTLWGMRKAGQIPGGMTRGKREVYFVPIVDDWIKESVKKGELLDAKAYQTCSN